LVSGKRGLGNVVVRKVSTGKKNQREKNEFSAERRPGRGKRRETAEGFAQKKGGEKGGDIQGVDRENVTPAMYAEKNSPA